MNGPDGSDGASIALKLEAFNPPWLLACARRLLASRCVPARNGFLARPGKRGGPRSGGGGATRHRQRWPGAIIYTHIVRARADHGRSCSPHGRPRGRGRAPRARAGRLRPRRPARLLRQGSRSVFTNGLRRALTPGTVTEATTEPAATAPSLLPGDHDLAQHSERIAVLRAR